MISSREYSFVLADGTFTALLHQITKKTHGVMNDQCFTRMIQALVTFLDPEYPIILDAFADLDANTSLPDPYE